MDFSRTLRTLAKAPKTPILIVLTLVLGITGSIVMFAVLDATLLHPIQAPAISNVVTLGGASAAPGLDRWKWYGHAPSLEFTSMVSSGGATIYSAAQHFSARVPAASVTDSFFRAFGVTPQVGADCTHDPSPSAELEAVVSSDLWRKELNRASILGTQIKVNNVPATIVGIAPPAFHFPGRTAIWVCDDARMLVSNLGYDAPSSSRERMIARLRAGRSIATAEGEARILQSRIASIRKLAPGVPVQVASLPAIYSESQREMVLTIFCVSWLLLMVACANAGSLMMTRTLSRRKEIAVRIALGGSRLKMLRLLLLDCLLISTLAGIIGVALSIAIDGWIKRTFSHVEPSLLNLRFNAETATFAMLIVLASTMILISVSASQVSKQSVLDPLKEGGHYSHGAIKSRLRQVLIFLQLCATFLLVAGEISSFSRLDLLLKRNYGFAPSQLMLANFTLPKSTYDTTDRVIQFQNSVTRTLSKRLGGRAVGIASKAPLLDGGDDFLDVTANDRHLQARVVLINGKYFQALHIPVLQYIQASPNEATVIVSQTFAEKMFPRQSALGRFMKFDWEDASRRIVGVVGNVKMSSAAGRQEAQIYIPYSHPMNSTISQRTMTIVAGAGQRGTSSIRAAFEDLAKAMPPGVPLFDVQEGDLLVSDATWQIRTRTEVLLILALITFVITAFGVYSSFAFSIDLRVEELAIRRALGGRTFHLLLLLMGDGLKLTLAAIVVGVIIYFLSWKALGAIVTDLPQLTPFTVGATSGALLLLMLLSTLAPALAAARATDFSVLRD